MTQSRPYYSSRQIIDVDDFLSRADDSYLMCISGSMVYALRKLAKTRLLWETTYAKTKAEQSYTLPDETDFDAIEDIVSEWIADSEEIEMCNAALINALQDIALATRESSCCFGAAGSGMEIGGDFYYGTETPLEAPTSFGSGEEFATEELWEAHKCEAANAIVNGLAATIANMSIFTLVNLTGLSIVAALIGIGLLTIPPVAIVLALIFTGFTMGALVTFSNDILDNQEELVCGLYNADGAIDAYDWLKEALEDIAIDLGVVEISIGPLIDLAMNLVTIDSLNHLYLSANIPGIPGEQIDCAYCGECDEYFVAFGVYDEQTQYLQSAWASETGRYEARIFYNYDESEPEHCGGTVTLAQSNKITGTPYNPGSAKGVRIRNQAGANLWEHISDFPTTSTTGVGSVWLNATTTNFTVELEV